MKDYEKVLKQFGIPSMNTVSLNDQILLTEYIKTQNPMYISGVILRILADNKSMKGIVKNVVKINDDLISLGKVHDERLDKLEEKIGSMYSFQDNSKKLN